MELNLNPAVLSLLKVSKSLFFVKVNQINFVKIECLQISLKTLSTLSLGPKMVLSSSTLLIENLCKRKLGYMLGKKLVQIYDKRLYLCQFDD